MQTRDSSFCNQVKLFTSAQHGMGCICMHLIACASQACGLPVTLTLMVTMLH